MKKIAPIGATLFLSMAIASFAQAQPYAETLLLPPAPTVVTLSGTLDLHGGKIVLVLDQPIALQSADRTSIDVASQSEIEVAALAVSVKEFHPKHVTVRGTLGRGLQGGALAVTLVGPQNF
jgi:pectin methylesterase-like acyl-CoA thioesterase